MTWNAVIKAEKMTAGLDFLWKINKAHIKAMLTKLGCAKYRLLILAVNSRLACLTSVVFVITDSKNGEQKGVFFPKTPLGYSKLRLLIIQSNLIVQYDMLGFPTGIMKVSSALAQREPKYIFHHRSPFIIHGNHLKSEALKFTDVYKHGSSGSTDCSAFREVHC